MIEKQILEQQIGALEKHIQNLTARDKDSTAKIEQHKEQIGVLRRELDRNVNEKGELIVQNDMKFKGGLLMMARIKELMEMVYKTQKTTGVKRKQVTDESSGKTKKPRKQTQQLLEQSKPPS